MLAASLPPVARVMSGPGLLPISISGSLTARVHVDVHDPCCHQGHGDAWGVGCHL